MIKVLNSLPISMNESLFYLTGKQEDINSIGKLKLSLIKKGYSADTVNFIDISDICLLDKEKNVILCQRKIKGKNRLFFIEIPLYLAMMFKSRYYGNEANLYKEVKNMYDASSDDMIDILRWYKDVLKIDFSEKQTSYLLKYARETNVNPAYEAIFVKKNKQVIA